MNPSSKALIICAFLLMAPLVAGAAPNDPVDADTEPLPTIGPAPDFTLTTQDGDGLALADLRSKVVVLTFLFTSCADTCPLLSVKLVGIQNELGDAFGAEVFFLSVTVDPEHDKPEVLKYYAKSLGCDLGGWAFLTGTPDEIRAVARRYGVFHAQQSGGDVDHNLLTSLVDRNGMLRVQYMGERFDSREFIHDLRGLMNEETDP